MNPELIRPIITSLILLVALGTFGYTAYNRISLMFRGRRKLNRLDNIPQRIIGVLQYAIAQQRMFKDPYAGIFHIMIFSGFVILGLRTVSLYVLAYSPDLFWTIFASLPGKVYLLSKDLIEPVVLGGIVMAVYRRVISKPARLTYSGEAVFILGMIGTLMITDLFYDATEFVLAARGSIPFAAEILSTKPFSPASGLVLAPLFDGAGDGFLHGFGALNFYIHIATVLVFLNFLPYGKHFHVITAIPNVFFRNLKSPGALSMIDDLEGRVEREENIGAGRIEDYSWKDVLDMYTCTECGRCQAVCPAWSTEKPLSPKKLIDDQRDHLYEKQDWIMKHEAGTKEDWEGEAMIGPVIAEDVIWSCTTCRNCETACPVMIEHVDRIVAMRRYLVTNVGEFPHELTRTFQGLERNGNPWNLGADKRFDWTEGLDVKILDEGESAEYLYWVGCAASYDDRNKKIAQSMVRIFNEAGVDYGIMPEESCNGDTARRAGNEYLFQIMAQANIENLNAHKTKKIVTHCPHCLNTLKNEYPDFGANFEVVHSTAFVGKLMDEGKIKLNPLETEGPVTFHDPCYLGRYNDHYESPRDLVEKSTGKQIVEAERSRENSMCCGAGGARMWVEEDAPRVNSTRYDQLMETGAKTVAVSCPFCMTMIDDANKQAGHEDVKVLDVIELVDKAMVKKASTA
jgi:Fe-S oxidoreductase